MWRRASLRRRTHRRLKIVPPPPENPRRCRPWSFLLADLWVRSSREWFVTRVLANYPIHDQPPSDIVARGSSTAAPIRATIRPQRSRPRKLQLCARATSRPMLHHQRNRLLSSETGCCWNAKLRCGPASLPSPSTTTSAPPATFYVDCRRDPHQFRSPRGLPRLRSRRSSAWTMRCEKNSSVRSAIVDYLDYGIGTGIRRLRGRSSISLSIGVLDIRHRSLRRGSGRLPCRSTSGRPARRPSRLLGDPGKRIEGNFPGR